MSAVRALIQRYGFALLLAPALVVVFVALPSFSDYVAHFSSETRWYAMLTPLLVAAGALAVLAGRRGWAPSLLEALVIALVVRVAVVLVSRGLTPADTSVQMHQVAVLVRTGRDPLVALPVGVWNFIPLMAYVYAASSLVPIHWDVASKIAPVGADIFLVVMVGLLADRNGPTRRLQYALNPVTLLITGVHGQIETVALAFACGWLYLASRARAPEAGGLIGLGIATKSWPVLFLPGVLRSLRRDRLAAIGFVALAPLFLLVTMPSVLNSLSHKSPATQDRMIREVALDATKLQDPAIRHPDLQRDIHQIISYRSLNGWWGWSGARCPLPWPSTTLPSRR